MEEDEIRILRYLLSKTTLQVRIKGATTTPFVSNIGSPQGDAVSGPLFTLYFEHFLRLFREEINRVPINIEEINQKWLEKRRSNLPKELTYADDCDFLTEDTNTKNKITNDVGDVFERGNLLVNQDKTEITIIRREKKEDEHWRNTKKLGTLLGDTEDIANRKRLATIALSKLNRLWLNKHKRVNLTRKIKLYNMLVKSILLYNSSTWGLTIQDEQNLDSFHRQQL